MIDTLRKRAFALADEFGLDPDERVEIAEMLLKKDVYSWSTLKEEDFQRLVDALEGARLLGVLKRMRG